MSHRAPGGVPMTSSYSVNIETQINSYRLQHWQYCTFLEQIVLFICERILPTWKKRT